MGSADIVRHLREFLNLPRAEIDLLEAARGRKPVAVIPSALATSALRSLEDAGVHARALRYSAWPRALPANFGVMIGAVLLMGMLAGLRGAPMLLWVSPVIALLLMVGAAAQMTQPLLPTARSRATLPQAVRASIADSLATLQNGHVRRALLDIASVGESTFASLSPAFRRAPLGESVLELLREAGPLAAETAQLEQIALELAPRPGSDAAAEFNRLSDAVSARTELLEHVIALLGRIAREGADSHGEVGELVQRVRAEAGYRAEAEKIVAKVPEAPTKA
jgi:hypothetical protein